MLPSQTESATAIFLCMNAETDTKKMGLALSDIHYIEVRYIEVCVYFCQLYRNISVQPNCNE